MTNEEKEGKAGGSGQPGGKGSSVVGTTVTQVAAIGMMEPFDVDKPEKWESYNERFTFYCLANRIQDDKSKLATLSNHNVSPSAR